MEEETRKTYRCTFTGHRPEKLRRSKRSVRKELKKAIHQAIEDGYLTFISGMARGVDIWAAQLVLEERKKNKELHLICAIPFQNFEKSWKYSWQRQYRKILAEADYIKYISDYYTGAEIFMRRNRWMIDHCSRLIAVFDGIDGGTKNTMLCAKDKGVEVWII